MKTKLPLVLLFAILSHSCDKQGENVNGNPLQPDHTPISQEPFTSKEKQNTEPLDVNNKLNTTSPIILNSEDAKQYIDICKQVPQKIKDAFELSPLLKEDFTYLQTIRMPTGNTLVILSCSQMAGLVVFDQNSNISQVLNWGRYMRGIFNLRCLDKAYYRFVQENDRWGLIVEYHAISYDEGGDHYLWQFNYGPNSAGSSKRYRLSSILPGESPKKD